MTDGASGSRNGVAYLCGAWLLTAAVHVYLIMPASVLPQIAGGLSIPETTAVWLISAVLVAWAVTNLGVGVVVDRFGDRIVIAVAGAITVAVAIGGWAVARNGLFWPLIATRVAGGVAIGAIFIASTALVGRLFTAGNRGTALGLFTTSPPAGFAIGQVVGPVVTDAAGWPAIFAVGGVLSLGALVVFAVVSVVISPTRADTLGTHDGSGASQPPDSQSDDPSVRGNFGIALRNRTVLLGGALAFIAYSLYLFLNSWLPTYLVTELGLSTETSGLLAAVFPAMGVLSRAGGGVLSDRVFGHRRLPVLKWSLVVTLPVMLLLTVSRSIAILVVLLIVGGFVIQLTFGVVYSYVQEAVDRDIEGTALSLLGSAGMTGAFSAPIVAGTLLDLTGSYTAAFLYAVVISVIGVGLVFGVAER